MVKRKPCSTWKCLAQGLVLSAFAPLPLPPPPSPALWKLRCCVIITWCSDYVCLIVYPVPRVLLFWQEYLPFGLHKEHLNIFQKKKSITLQPLSATETGVTKGCWLPWRLPVNAVGGEAPRRIRVQQ